MEPIGVCSTTIDFLFPFKRAEVRPYLFADPRMGPSEERRTGRRRVRQKGFMGIISQNMTVNTLDECCCLCFRKPVFAPKGANAPVSAVCVDWIFHINVRGKQKSGRACRWTAAVLLSTPSLIPWLLGWPRHRVDSGFSASAASQLDSQRNLQQRWGTLSESGFSKPAH